LRRSLTKLPPEAFATVRGTESAAGQSARTTPGAAPVQTRKDKLAGACPLSRRPTGYRGIREHGTGAELRILLLHNGDVWRSQTVRRRLFTGHSRTSAALPAIPRYASRLREPAHLAAHIRTLHKVLQRRLPHRRIVTAAHLTGRLVPAPDNLHAAHNDAAPPTPLARLVGFSALGLAPTALATDLHAADHHKTPPAPRCTAPPPPPTPPTRARPALDLGRHAAQARTRTRAARRDRRHAGAAARCACGKHLLQLALSWRQDGCQRERRENDVGRQGCR
jgi:hypothetical protein